MRNKKAERYFKLVNLVDCAALSDRISDTQIDYIEKWAKLSDIKIEDFADANNCSGCSTWKEVIDSFKSLFVSGERVAI